MRTLLIAIVFGVLLTTAGISQDKNEKGCCSDEKSKTTMNKNCNVTDEVSNSSNVSEDLVASVQDDVKNKKVDKNVKRMDKNMIKDKSKYNSSGDGCCSSDQKKNNKTTRPKP